MMKSRKINLVYGFLVAVLTAILLLTGCGGTDVYDYPIKPGTDEWAALRNNDHKIEVCQIPEDILENMSTEGLTETVLDYPLLFGMMAYSTVQYGFDKVSSDFNGLQELLNREDGGSEIMALYCATDPAAIEDDWTDIEKGEYAINLMHIEIILAQEEILDSLTSTQLRVLVEECLIKYHQKQQVPEAYGNYGLQSTLRLMGRVLEHENYGPFMEKVSEKQFFQDFLDTGSWLNDEMKAEILANAECFLLE